MSALLETIVELSEAEQRLLSAEELTDEEKREFTEIRKSLAKLWPLRRAELVYAQHGPPVMISGCDPKSQPQVRRFAEEMTARGMQPLPSALEVGR